MAAPDRYLFLSMNDLDFAARVSAPIGQLYHEAKRSLSAFPKHALVQARALASLCCDLLGAPLRQVQPCGLDGQIAALARAHRINPDTRELLQRLRRWGNAGAHPEGAVLAQEEFPSIATQALGDVRTLLEIVFRQQHRGAPVPRYAVADEGPDALPALTYRAMCEGSAADQYLLAIHLVQQVRARVEEVRSQARGALDRQAAQHQVDAMRRRAIDLLEYASDAGHTPAHYEYGQALLEGARGEGQEQEASQRIWRACRAGYPEAMAWIGNAALYGLHGHEVDFKRAREYLEQAAAHDELGALTLLSRMYRSGLGVAADPAAGFAMTLRAAQAGFRFAQYDAACALLEGDGIEVDQAAALDWLEQAAQAGLPAARRLKARLIMQGIAPGSRDDAEQLLLAVIPAFNEARLDLADLYLESGEPGQLIKAANLAQLCHAQALRDKDEQLVALCLTGSPAVVEKLDRSMGDVPEALATEMMMARFLFDEHGRPYADRVVRAKLFLKTLADWVAVKGSGSREEQRLRTMLIPGKPPARAPRRVRTPILLPAVTPRQAIAKVGRNQACPCGSGVKFKQCCA